MMAGDAEAADRLAVLQCRVSDIGLPAITGIPGCETTHDPVARDLRDDRGGGDREAERVAFDDGLHGTSDRRGDYAVDECGIGARPEHRHGARHRQQSRTQNIKTVNFERAGGADPDAGGAPLGAPLKRAVAGFPLLSGQGLRIVENAPQHFGKTVGIKNHGGRDHRPRQRPSPRLVDAAYQALAPSLDREIRHRPSPPLGLCHKAALPGKAEVS